MKPGPAKSPPSQRLDGPDGGVRLVPTALGMKALLFYATLIAAFYAAPYMNLFFLLMVFAATVAGCSLWWTWRNVAGASAAVLHVEPAPAGVAPRATVLVRAPARTRYTLQCTVSIAGKRLPVATAGRCAADADCIVEGTLPALPRGLHSLSEARLTSSYPFGFARAWRRAKSPPYIVVYPAPVDLGAARDRRQLIAQLEGELAGGEPDAGEAVGLRDYRPGDEPRTVHWKASARRAGLVVIERETDARTGIEVLLDLRHDPDTLEPALQLIAGLAQWARTNKDVLVLHSQDVSGSYGECQRPWDELWTYLATAAPLPSDAPAPPPVAPGVLRLPRTTTTGATA